MVQRMKEMFQSFSEYLCPCRPKVLHVPSVESHTDSPEKCIQKLLQQKGLKHSSCMGKEIGRGSG